MVNNEVSQRKRGSLRLSLFLFRAPCTLLLYDQGFSGQHFLQHIGRAYIAETLYMQGVVLQ